MCGTWWKVGLKLYIPSRINTQMNLSILLFMGRLGRQCSTDNFCDFEYPTFGGLFYPVLMRKTKYKIRVSVHSSIRTKCLINIILTLKCTFWVGFIKHIIGLNPNFVPEGRPDSTRKLGPNSGWTWNIGLDLAAHYEKKFTKNV